MKKLMFILLPSIILWTILFPSYGQNGNSGIEKLYTKSREYKLAKTLALASGEYLLFGNTTAGKYGGYDIFISRTDNKFEILDESFYGDISDDYFFDAFQLNNGDIVFFGKKAAIVNNNPRWNLFYTKLSQNGKKTFYREFVSFENDSIAQSRELPDGDVLLIGNKEDWGDRDQNIWLSCFNDKGNLKWQVNIGERYIDEIGLDVIHDGDSYFLLAEKREQGKITPLIIKTDLTGNIQWQKEIEGMQGYNLNRFFLGKDNSFVVFGVEKSFTDNKLVAFQIDKSARLIQKSIMGNFDQNAFLSFTQDEESIFVLSNTDSRGRVYKYNFQQNTTSFASVNHEANVKFIELSVDKGDFVMGGNISIRNEPKVYLQKNHLSFEDVSESNMEIPKDQVRAESGLSQIEVLSPPNNMGIARMFNANKVSLKLKINSEKPISDVFSNDTKMSAVGDKIYTLDVALKEGYNDFEVKAVTNDGNTITKYVSIENILGEKSTEMLSKGKSYALIITVNHYSDPSIVGLDNPKNDGESLVSTLQSLYTFEKENTYFLVDPTREDIITKFDELVKEIGKDDNLLIFYAGHGYWDKNTNIGYWLPSDAKKSNTANWLSNSTIKDFISAIPSKHTLLIADACFSGGIFKTRKAFSDNIASVDKLYELPSRKAMTSGALTEVPDKSVFIQYLVKRLNENDKKYISSEELFSSMRSAVLNNSTNVPQYGEIQGSGDEGGDFIFIRRDL